MRRTKIGDMAMIEKAKVTDSWHITIPKNVRELMKLEKGDYLRFVWKDGLISIMPERSGDE